MSTSTDPQDPEREAAQGAADAAAAPRRRVDALGLRHAERHGWQRLVFEVGLLIASAMLALAVNDWNNERERARLAQRVLVELQVEVGQNRAAIDGVLAYHEKMRDRFHASREALARGDAWEYPAEFEGLNQILFQRAAYDSALLSQTLPHLESNTLSALSALYTQQEEYTQNLRLYAAATLQTDDKDSRRDLRLTENCFRSMASSEKRLVALLDKARGAIAAELQAGR